MSLTDTDDLDDLAYWVLGLGHDHRMCTMQDARGYCEQ